MERLKFIKGAIFDLDGTLLDSMGIWETIDKIFLSNRGIEIPEDYVDAVNPMCFKDAAIYTIKRFSLKETPEELMQDWHDLSIQAYKNEIKMKPFAKEYLLRLKNCGIKLAIATALSPELYIPVLKNNGIYELFDCYSSLEDVSRGKGFPDIYNSAALKLNLIPCECAVFEDIYLGIKGANDGGFISVAIYDKFSDFEKDDIIKNADIYIKSFKELMII